MPAPQLNRQTLESYIGRVKAIAEVPRGKWGTMSAAQMFNHMNLSIGGSLGEVPIEDKSNFALKLMRPIIFSGLVPFPKGRAQTAPEFVAKDECDFAEEQEKLVSMLERFVEMCEQDPDGTRLHPLFGPMTMPQWQQGHAVHFEHHLKQFGV